MKFSIITVVFNNKDVIQGSIESVLSQDYKDLEYIVIDGGSTDGTIDLIDSYKERISLIVSEPDQGKYDAMNKGLSLASGEVVGFLHADDFYTSENVIKKVADVLEDSNLDGCYSDLIYVDRVNTDKVVRYWKSCEYQDGLFEKGWCPPHPTLFIKKAIYEEFGGFDLTYRLGNDVELMMRYFARHHIATRYIPEIFIKMRLGGESNMSVSNIVNQNREILKAAKNNKLFINPLLFYMHKFISRSVQFINKPHSFSSNEFSK